jgi:hypothetical protein
MLCIQGSVLLSFSCSRLAYEFFWLQKYLSTAGAVTGSCGPVATHLRAGESAGGLSSEELSRTLHLRAQCETLYRRVPSFVSLPLCLGVVCFQLFIIFISFWEIQKLDGSKSEKLEAPFHELLSFLLFGPSSFWISQKLIHKSDKKLEQTPP